jgi:hypothetical protein
MPEQLIFVGRWYNDRLNPIYYQAIFDSVALVSDRHLRRTNTRIGNAFHDITSKLEIIGLHVHSIRERLRLGGITLAAMLQDLEADLNTDPAGNRHAAMDADWRVEFYDYVMVAHFEGLLIQSKALLDSLCQLYSIAFTRNVRTFSNAGVNLMNDLDHLGADLASYAPRIKSLLEGAKPKWIDRLVTFRDQVVHYGQLRDMHCQMLRLDGRLKYTERDVVPAVVPGDQPLGRFVALILDEAHAFARDMVAVCFERLRTVHGRE